MILTLVISSITIIITCVILWLKKQHKFWTKLGLVQPPTSLLFGHMQDAFQQSSSFGEVCVKYHNYFTKLNIKHGGLYFLWMPLYMPVDPTIIKNILQNDFQHFTERGIYYNEQTDPLSANLFAVNGTKWRSLRPKLTPTFTSGRIKMMLQTLLDCSEQLLKEINKCCNNREAIEIKDLLGRFTMDVIGSCAFGIQCNSFENKNSKFKECGDRFFQKTPLENIIAIFTYTNPDVMSKFGTRVITKFLSEFFISVIKETVRVRESANVYRKDFMHLLLQLKNRGKLVDDEHVLKRETDITDEKSNHLTFNEIAAQAFVFFVAGYETSSTTMTFCLFELALNVEIQENLIREIKNVLEQHDGKLTYNCIADMILLDKVIKETLRKYPPLGFLNRMCTKDYKVPNTNLTLRKGTKIVISTMALQNDPNNFPNPEKFDPERFSDENLPNITPFTYLPFGDGPRNCIGLRFGMIQTKVGIISLLKSHRISLNPKTTLPLKIDPASYILSVKGGMWMDLTKHT